ncbi:MAG: fasciclin domain-containing protein [Planctomycetia bacterium]|nr:fasciclin domain-containing protein [Planctomycetia bacterium]
MSRAGFTVLLLACCLCFLTSPGSAPAQKGAKDIFTTLKLNGVVFKSWTKAIEQAGLTKIYQGKEPMVTMFAPNEDAFGKLKKDDLDELWKDKVKLIKLVTYHTIENERLEVEQIAKKGKLQNALLVPLMLKKEDDGNIKINGALIVTPDVPATNGIIHGLDGFLVPPLK